MRLRTLERIFTSVPAAWYGGRLDDLGFLLDDLWRRRKRLPELLRRAAESPRNGHYFTGWTN